jgi:hypothetical protein
MPTLVYHQGRGTLRRVIEDSVISNHHNQSTNDRMQAGGLANGHDDGDGERKKTRNIRNQQSYRRRHQEQGNDDAVEYRKRRV